jgi:hypothetical protein
MAKYLHKLEQYNKLPITLDQIRYHINAHPHDPDEYIEQIGLAACQITETRLAQSIILSKWELTQERDEIILDRPPVNKIESVEVKGRRKWISLDVNNPDVVERTFSCNGSVKVRVMSWIEKQKVRITYTAGYGDSILKMPASIMQYVLNLCIALYQGRPYSREMAHLQDQLISPYVQEQSWSLW